MYSGRHAGYHGNSSAQDFALAAKSVRTCKLCREGICPSPKAELLPYQKCCIMSDAVI